MSGRRCVVCDAQLRDGYRELCDPCLAASLAAWTRRVRQLDDPTTLPLRPQRVTL